MSLGALKEIVRRSDLMVTNDTGPRHIAAAMDVPVVTIFGPTHPEWTEIFYPKERQVAVKVFCGPCQKKICPLDHRCMTRATPAMVYDAAMQLLGKGCAKRRHCPSCRDHVELLLQYHAARPANALDVVAYLKQNAGSFLLSLSRFGEGARHGDFPRRSAKSGRRSPPTCPLISPVPPLLIMAYAANRFYSITSIQNGEQKDAYVSSPHIDRWNSTRPAPLGRRRCALRRVRSRSL